MYYRISLWTLVGLKITSMCFINAQASDIMAQDWGSDIYQWSEPLEAPNVQHQGDFTQTDLFGSTGDTLQSTGLTGPEDPDLFDWMDLNAPASDFDNTLAADIDFITTSCTSDSSQPRISKRKKSKNICPADSTSSSSSRVKQPDCRPESEICPIGKTAMCCDGEQQGWLKWYGFSVGGCIKCKICFLSQLPSSINSHLFVFSSNTDFVPDGEGDNCRLSVCQVFNTLYCCDFLGMALMVRIDPLPAYLFFNRERGKVVLIAWRSRLLTRSS